MKSELDVNTPYSTLIADYPIADSRLQQSITFISFRRLTFNFINLWNF